MLEKEKQLASLRAHNCPSQRGGAGDHAIAHNSRNSALNSVGAAAAADSGRSDTKAVHMATTSDDAEATLHFVLQLWKQTAAELKRATLIRTAQLKKLLPLKHHSRTAKTARSNAAVEHEQQLAPVAASRATIEPEAGAAPNDQKVSERWTGSQKAKAGGIAKKHSRVGLNHVLSACQADHRVFIHCQ